LPVGGWGGRADVMDVFNPRSRGGLSHAGTFNGNPLTTAAGCASLDLLPATEVERINRLGDQLAAGVRDAMAATGVPGTVTSCGSLVHLHFESPAEITTFRDVNLHSATLLRLHAAALEEGLYIAPRGTLNTSTALDAATVAEAVTRLERSLARVAASSGVSVP
jgi:glutamate-1-semialdehyde 2,1-aminomutase